MSKTVLTIGFGHAIFPLIGYLISGKIGLWLGVVLGIFIAIAFGGARYAVIDLVGVGTGTVVALCLAKGYEKK